MENGEADVVGGIFFSPERVQKFSFSSHYYQIPANIFFHSSIYGLRNLKDLDGFRVGVVAQDYSVTYLLNNRPALNLVLYSNAEMMIKAAHKGEIRVMVGDAPVIRFYLAKYELIDEFKQPAKALYRGKVNSAVKKGNTQTLNLVAGGFAKITDEELSAITEKWVGIKVWKRLPWFWISIGLAGGVLVLLIMFLWNRQLSRRIQTATSDIRSKQRALEKSRQELKEREAFFRHFTEHTEDCIMRFAREFRHLYVNRVAELTTGIKMADFIGKTHQELGFPEDLTKQWHSALEEVFSTGEPKKIEFQLPNGIWMDWLVFPEKGPEGEVKNVMTSAREITDRKRAEQEIRRLGQFLEGVIENANVWLTVLDADYKVLIWNRAAEPISGYNRVVGSRKIWRNLFSDQVSRAFAFSKIKEVFNDLLSLEDIETPIRTRMGGKKVIAWNLRPLMDEKGKSSGLIAMGREVTENADLEERLRQSQKMEVIGTLASGVAHGFNNLLQAMTSYVQLLLFKCEDRTDEHKYLMEIAGSVDRAADLVNRLLAFGRKMASRPRLLERTIPKMVRIETRAAPDLRLVNADSTQLEQVLVNLANNAKDAMSEGGRLTTVTENACSSGREKHSLEGGKRGLCKTYGK
ncbi:PAS domain S-box protein [Dethiosulfatarculus sandiegensis]|uniref:histidine kinase n=1 Tax=Dethiosulfatarculus sandiegensis TaxID=1429043 RepID=A0A0D2JGB5_9BACT|nr:PAS domain S-box protein [Dethiosulfatarculus sandiegensis]KIX14776.1 hypothetical protein X474_06435 [Dethiosulfatarculus sandiegensis]